MFKKSEGEAIKKEMFYWSIRFYDISTIDTEAKLNTWAS
jgi:hypothetical protein